MIAVLIGVAAALLSRPVGPVGPSSPSVGGLTGNQVAQLATVVLLIGVGLWLFFTLREGTNRLPIPGRVVATFLVILLLGALFVVVAGFVHVAPIPASTNTTGKSSPPGGGSTNNGSGNGTTGLFGTHGITLPAWAGFVAVLAVAILAGLLLAPFLIARAERRRRRLDEVQEPAREARKALHEALHRLRSAPEADARATILALYGRLLLLVGPRLGPIDSLTPGEIESRSIEALGLRPLVARDLTQTFEEARYSTHPMTTEAVGRARAALAEAISDLAQTAGVPS